MGGSRCIPHLACGRTSTSSRGTAAPRPAQAGASYHSSSYGPLRTYVREEIGGSFDDYTSSVTVLHAGGDNYAVLSCSWYYPFFTLLPSSTLPCTLSGVGPALTRLTGRATNYAKPSPQVHVMQWQALLAR